MGPPGPPGIAVFSSGNGSINQTCQCQPGAPGPPGPRGKWALKNGVVIIDGVKVKPKKAKSRFQLLKFILKAKRLRLKLLGKIDN